MVVSAEHAPSRRSLAIRAGAGVAALGVLLAAALLVAAEDGGTDSADGTGSEPGFAVAHTKAWSAQPAAALQPGTDDTLVGSWLLSDAVVRADAAGVHAYDRADGKPTWSVEPRPPAPSPAGFRRASTRPASARHCSGPRPTRRARAPRWSPSTPRPARPPGPSPSPTPRAPTPPTSASPRTR
ncbi:hypothetical protein ACFQ0M_33950 [Kitasatospora aburaviensis]